MIEMHLDTMTIAEKLTVMETLWDDLCAHSQIASPAWHQEVLNHRHQLHQSGEQQPMAWSEAKMAIRERIK